MEIPFDYVIFYLMFILGMREKSPKINKKNLSLIFENLIQSYF